MADYSYVTVTVEDTPANRGILENWAERLGDVYLDSFVVTGEDGAPVALVQAVVEEARYGFPDMVYEGTGDNDVRKLLNALMDAGIAWEGYDGGGYEWPETAYAWWPGGTVRRQLLDGTGEPVLTLGQWRWILNGIAHPDSYGAAAVVEAVERHFQPLALW